MIHLKSEKFIYKSNDDIFSSINNKIHQKMIIGYVMGYICKEKLHHIHKEIMDDIYTP